MHISIVETVYLKEVYAGVVLGKFFMKYSLDSPVAKITTIRLLLSLASIYFGN